MKYAYNITLNLQQEFYDFFDWNQKDKITNFKKLPILKVTPYDFLNIQNSAIKFDKKQLFRLFNIKNIFLISNGKNIMGITINKKGLCTHKSSLQLNEEEKLSRIITNQTIVKINYQLIKKKDKNNFLTRKEKEIKLEILKKLSKLNKNREKDKIKYLYLECFNKKENNVKKAYNIIKKEIKNNNCDIICNFLKIIK